MPTPQELEAKFWKCLKSDKTLMLGLDGVEDGHARPMTAQVEGDKGPLWFFRCVTQDEGAASSIHILRACQDCAILSTISFTRVISP